jgi:hypothetical protein
MTKDDMRNNRDEIDDWFYVFANKKLSEDYIREFRSKVDWGNISCHQKLSDDFIRKFQVKVNWEMISEYQKLSEDKPNTNLIYSLYYVCYQDLSEDFIDTYKII